MTIPSLMRVFFACCLVLVLSSPPLATTPEDVRVFATNGDIAALAEAVVAEDLEVRRAALAALEIVGISEEGDRALITALNDEEPEIRRDAARILGEAGNPRAIDSLIALLGDPFTFVRTEALEALIKLDEPLGPLIHDTLEGSEEARLELIQRDDPRILVPLVNALGHLDSKIRHTARGIISLYRDARVVPLLCEKLDSRSSDARWNAAELLQEMGDERAVQSLIRTLTDGESRVRIAVTTALGQIADERATEPLIRTLSDPDPLVREAAAYALGDFDAEAVVPPLVKMLRDRVAKVREASAWSLSSLADPRTLEPLIRLVDDWSTDVRRAAAVGLGSLKDSRATMPLIGLLDDEVARVREAAMNALGEIADPRAVDPILPRLQDKDLKPRISAAIALGAIGNREAIPALIRSMGDPAPEVRLAAAAALEKLEEPLGRWIESALGDDPRGRQSLILANDARAVEPLIAALSDPDWKCRRAAAFALAGFKDERAQKELVRMAGKWNPRDRMLAIAALGEVERSGGFREIAGLVLKILLRPASLAYLFGVILLLFGTYRLARPRHP